MPLNSQRRKMQEGVSIEKVTEKERKKERRKKERKKENSYF